MADGEDPARPESLPPNWVWARLQQLAAHERNSMTDGPFGSKLKTADYVDAGIRVIRLGNLGVGQFKDTDQAFVTREKFETLRKHETFAGDLVIAALAEPVGRAVEVPATAVPAIVKADCVRLKVHPEVSHRYVMYALNSPGGRARAEAKSHGIGRLRINMANMRALTIPLAPSNEQRRIVGKIEALFARSRRAKGALNAIPALLDRLRQSILAAAFRGDLTADWRAQHPDVVPADKLLERIHRERRHRWQEAELVKMRAKGKEPKNDKWKAKYKEPPTIDGELPDLPPTWAWAAADGIVEPGIDIVYGIVQPGPEIEGGIPYVRGKDIQNGRILVDQLRRTSPQIAERYHRAALKGGDVLLGIIRATKVAVVPSSIDGANITQGTARFRPSSVITTEYLAGWLDCPWAQSWLHSCYRGIDMPGLNLRDVRRLPVALAPLEEQEEIASRVGKALGHVTRLQAQLEALIQEADNLEASVLQQAFQGRLVTQDSNDEPASLLLERLATASETKKRTQAAPAKRKRASRKPVRSDPQPSKGQQELKLQAEPGFKDLEPAQRSGLVVAALAKRGRLPFDEAIRAVAEHLRDLKIERFKRFRKGGPLSREIQSAIRAATREGVVDRPARGNVRAVLPRSDAYTREHWRTCLLQVIDGNALDRDEAIRIAAEWARENLGLEYKRLRSDGKIVKSLKSALTSAIRRGELERVGASKIRRVN